MIGFERGAALCQTFGRYLQDFLVQYLKNISNMQTKEELKATCKVHLAPPFRELEQRIIKLRRNCSPL